jgi:hypothetical protein
MRCLIDRRQNVRIAELSAFEPVEQIKLDAVSLCFIVLQAAGLTRESDCNLSELEELPIPIWPEGLSNPRIRIERDPAESDRAHFVFSIPRCT